jgi:hypothetical protein
MGNINSNLNQIQSVPNFTASSSSVQETPIQAAPAPKSEAEKQSVFAENQKLSPVNDLTHEALAMASEFTQNANSSEIKENMGSKGLPDMLKGVSNSHSSTAKQVIEQTGSLANSFQNVLAPVGDIAHNVLAVTGLDKGLNDLVGGNASGALDNVLEINELVSLKGITDPLSRVPDVLNNSVGHLLDGDVIGAGKELVEGVYQVNHDLVSNTLESLPNLAGSVGNLVGNAAPIVANLADKAGEVLPGLLASVAPIADAVGGEEAVKALSEITGALAPTVSQVANTAAKLAPGLGEDTEKILGAIVPGVSKLMGDS